jgi:hypothetical protein
MMTVLVLVFLIALGTEVVFVPSIRRKVVVTSFVWVVRIVRVTVVTATPVPPLRLGFDGSIWG